jgi:CRP-like cAMP-binding protein
MTANLKSLETIDKDLQVSNIALKNELLRDLLAAHAENDSLLSELSVISLSPSQVLYEQGDQIDFVYFPIDSVVSGLAIMEDGTTVETSMVGREGLVGISAILGSGRSRQWMWVLISGSALQLDARLLEKRFVHNEQALTSLLRCYRSLVTQVSQRCVCNTRHTILERLCCWLLMIQDRVGGSNLGLTQETMASRVGARRAGITIAAGMLQALHAIEYRRGQLHIVNRQVLERTVCECYTIMQAEFQAHRFDDYSTLSL